MNAGLRRESSPHAVLRDCNCNFTNICGLPTRAEFDGPSLFLYLVCSRKMGDSVQMIPTTANSSDNLLVANLQTVSLEKLVRSKLEVLFQQQQEAQVELDGLHKIVLEQVEKPLIELALRVYNGNQVKTARMLGINRNTLKKKIDSYK